MMRQLEVLDTLRIVHWHVYISKQPHSVIMSKKYGFAEIVESFLTWNEGRTKIVQCATKWNSSHSETINKFQSRSN
jgi:hypothetical protein